MSPCHEISLQFAAESFIEGEEQEMGEVFSYQEEVCNSTEHLLGIRAGAVDDVLSIEGSVDGDRNSAEDEGGRDGKRYVDAGVGLSSSPGGGSSIVKTAVNQSHHDADVKHQYQDNWHHQHHQTT